MTQPLLQDWVEALKGVKAEHIQQLLDIDPTLLWQPLPFYELDYPKTMTHFKDTFYQHFKDLTITQIYSIQLLMIILFEKPLPSEFDEVKLLSYLIGFATAADLNTCFWGSTKNTTLHLASILGQSTTIFQQLLDQGASADIPNSDGYLAKDVTYVHYEADANLTTNNNNSANNNKENNSNNSNTGYPNSSTTINRFKQLRQLAEDGGTTVSSALLPTSNTTTRRQNSTRRYFQPGHLEERRKKVLQEEKQSTESDHNEDKILTDKRKGKTDIHRKQEVESLAKQSRVRNNPLLKKFQEQHQEQQERSSPQPSTLSTAATARKKFLELGLERSNDRRISKGITSLKDGSFVSASVFRRQQQDTTSDNGINKSGSTTLSINRNDQSSSGDNMTNSVEIFTHLDNAPYSNELESHISDDIESIPPTNTIKPSAIDEKASNENDTHGKDRKGDGYLDKSANKVDEITDTTVADVQDWRNTNNFQPTPTARHKPHQSASRKSHQSLASDSESEQWFDSYEEYAENEARKSAILLSNVQRQSLPKQHVDQKLAAKAKVDDAQVAISDLNDRHLFDTSAAASVNESCTQPNNVTIDTNSIHRSSHETEVSQDIFKFQSPATSEDESVNTWPPPSPKSYISDYKETTFPPVPALPEKEVHSILLTDSKTDETAEEPPIQQQTKKKSTIHHIEAIDASIVVRRLSLYHNSGENTANSLPSSPSSSSEHNNYVDIRQHEQQQQQEHSTTAAKEVQPLTDNKPHPILPLIPETASSGYGKIYIRMARAHDILLPLPIETTYVRCVISDGRQEYISRYEVLANKVQFRYECTLDTYPNMIVSVALQVRPDPHVRPLTGLLNRLLFNSAYRQKKTLLGYVHPEDFIIGQARFALQDMTPVCNQKSYSASFDCFNSWFVQSNKERRRAIATAGGQVIKVVGQLAVDMLYLPVSDPSMNIPNSLQECDLALRIRQWHGTCWCRGYLSTRQKDEKVWYRQYFRLVGSRLLGFDSADDGANFISRYDITDAIQLIVAADQVLVDTENSNTSQQNQLIFSQNAICEDNRRGFFRVTFSNGGHIDCVSDYVYDSEAWVRTLRAMIGRVPLTVSAAVFLE